MEYIVKEHLHYGGIPTFNHTPYTQDLKDVDIAIMGVPFDVGVTNRPGARFGPRAIRGQSGLACCFKYPWNYKLFETAKIVDYGDVGYYIGPKTTEVMLQETYDTAKKVFESGAKLMTLGGDHTIPYGMVRAASEKFGKLALILIHIRIQLLQQTETSAMQILPTICNQKVALIQPILHRFLSAQK